MYLKWQRRSKVPPFARVRSVIQFLNAKCESPAEIHKQIVAVFGNVMNLQNMTKWCRQFSEGRTDVHDEQSSGRPSLISEELLQKIEGEIQANRRMTIRGCITSFTKCLRPQFLKLWQKNWGAENCAQAGFPKC